MIKSFTRRKGLFFSACVGLALIIGFFAVRSSEATPSIPTAEVKRGEFVDYLQVRGEIKANKTLTVTAPSGAGDLLIVKLAHTGTAVKKGEAIVQFDTTTLQRTLEQKKTELASAEAQIRQQRAQENMAQEQNLTDSLNAKFDVESAKLEASKAEILSEIDGEKNKLTLATDQEKYHAAVVKLDSGKKGAEADIAQKEKKRDKALFDVRLTEHQIQSLTIHAPSDGVVTVLPNYRAVQWGPNAPDFREGDRVWSGSAIAELPDLSSIRFESRLEEADRGKLRLDQSATVHIDALPDTDFNAKVSDISTVAKLDFSSWPPTKSFMLNVGIGNSDPRIRPGMKANTRIAVSRVPDAILVPSQAVIAKGSTSIVYVQHGRQFDERQIHVGHRTGDTVMVLSGLQPGERVALKDPNEGAAEK
jgi:HlyD family secretion protein